MHKLRLMLSALLLICLSNLSVAKEPEKHYQQIFCSSLGGAVEVILEDNSRADCLTTSEAIEVDFAHKWAEAIGQSLLYSKMLDKAPAVLLIVNEKSSKYLARFHNASDGLGVKLYIIEE